MSTRRYKNAFGIIDEYRIPIRPGRHTYEIEITET